MGGSETISTWESQGHDAKELLPNSIHTIRKDHKGNEDRRFLLKATKVTKGRASISV
jgi:hypothetical protein